MERDKGISYRSMRNRKGGKVMEREEVKCRERVGVMGLGGRKGWGWEEDQEREN